MRFKLHYSKRGFALPKEEDAQYHLAFSIFPGIGPVRFRLLTQYFGNAKKAWIAPVPELREVGLPSRLLAEFIAFRDMFSITDYMKRLSRLGVLYIAQCDARYPQRLREISDPPIGLFVRGKEPINIWNTEKIIAVVGTRNITSYGEHVTSHLVAGLVLAGFTIVSGMAYGVDAIAHKTTIGNRGKTIAVLGCGIDIIAPSSNAYLYRAIAGEHGAVISEMPLSLQPVKGLFPARNRIISGLSLGVLVTEGASDSGALITARYAAEQGRDVFAVPGPITSSTSMGPAKLLKEGAKIVTDVADILEEFGMAETGTRHSRSFRIPADASADERVILEQLMREPLHIDRLSARSNLQISVVSATLSLLEIKGIVKEYGEKVYGLI